MKTIFNYFSKRLAVLALGSAVIVAGSALAFTQKPKATLTKATLNLPVDERPVTRDLGGRASFAPVVKRVTPGVVKVYTTTKARNTAFNGPPEMDDFFGISYAVFCLKKKK